MADTSDVLVESHGSIVLLRTRSDAAVAWVNTHIDPETSYQPYWPDVVIEPRYVEAVTFGMLFDGLEVEEATL
jgi:hypothetical protein